ncbi:MAG: hypothetical protein ACRDQ4_22680 [Pseudonocardiaceae bacterium]
MPMAPLPVKREIKPPTEEDEVVLIPDFDQFAAAQTGLACGDDVPYR